ncbi:SDR family oxidoreductase [Niabella ginsengisoli]|uniref:SDR family oxidoreductase n=1 Tax=Niabella ginsengisoli TaxID=522298 RepID=A0ABS9SLM2_9BACT|nr:SDR family oxidoreductase [Niabella ginsengisoli]MCH5599181.1 SDR family oxidoreductase [Niabella ginsengisoli]
MSNTKFSLAGKVIIVTGATGVLGHSFVKDLAAQGATVGVLGRNEKVAEERVAEIESAGGKAIALIADVSNQQQLEAALKKVLDKYGKVDGLVNAAGGNQPGAVVQPDDKVFELNIDALKQVMDLNLFGTLLPTQVFGKAMAETSERGSIVNISSVAAHGAVTRVLGYSLAKTAIEAYTKWFAVEMANRYGDKLRMNALVPGFFLAEQNRRLLTNEDGSYTDRGDKVIRSTPYKRFGNPNELTGALIWLLSDESTFVNGTSIKVDGGFTIFSGV